MDNIIKNSKSDTAVVNAYNAASNLFAGSNPDTIVPISEKVLAIIDKALVKANKTESRALKLNQADTYNNLGYVYQLKGELDKALESFQKALQNQTEVNAREKTGLTLNNIAVVYYRLGKMRESLDAYDQSIKIRQEQNDQPAVAQSLCNMGAVLFSIGQTETALDNFHKSLTIREKIGDKLGKAVSLNNIASIYQNIGQRENALKYFKQSYDLYASLSNKEGMAIALHNIASIYDKQNKLEEALKNNEESMKLYESIGDKVGLVASLINVGSIYRKLGNNEKALSYLQKGLNLAESLGDKRGISFAQNNIGTVLLMTSKPEEALKFAQGSLAVAKEGSYIEATRNSYLLLAKIDSALGKNSESYENYKQYIKFRDSLASETTRKLGIKKQMQYEYEKKDAAAKLEQEKKEAIHLEELRKQKQINWLSAGALVLVLISSLLFFNRYRLKQKNKFQQKINEQQKEQANAVMETQEQERKRIAEDLHDSLGHLLSATKLNLQTLPSGQKQIDNSIQLLNQAAEEIRNITFNLMPRTLEEGGLIPALNELATKVTHSGTVKVILNVHDMDKFILEKQSQFNIYRIVQEAVNNILKHAGASEINIQVIGQTDHITIMIEDDGKGFDMGSQKNGRGLKNIVTRSLWLKGSLNIDSRPGHGTTITTEFPI